MPRYYDNYENTIEWLKDDNTATLTESTTEVTHFCKWVMNAA